MDDTFDAVVIGGGVIGLAVGRALALAGRDVVILEAESRTGLHASSRNSEVIHAGIYYLPGSLKASLCVQGREMLYAYCIAQDIDHKKLGKIIVSTEPSEEITLESYVSRAALNGVTDLQWLTASQVTNLEPAVRATRGLLSPSTGIVDSHSYMMSLRADAEASGAVIVCSAPVTAGSIQDPGFRLTVAGTQPFSFNCKSVVNCAGLFAPKVAGLLDGFPEQHLPQQYFAKGHYYELKGRSPFSRLVYPVAVPGGLGTHVTLDLSGQARFGPDVEWIENVDYNFGENRETAFLHSIRRYFPGIRNDDLRPGYTGIRAKLGPAGSKDQDFVIQSERTHGVSGLVNLFGIESPGLTASLAIAEAVCRELQ